MVFEQLCAEFKISSSSADFRQKLDPSKGMGATKYYTSHTTYSHHHMRMKKEKVLETGGDYDPSRGDFTTTTSTSNKFGSGPSHVYKIEYIEQTFSLQPSTKGSFLDAIGSFVLDKSSGFTQAGVSKELTTLLELVQWRNQGWARWATRPPLENSREKF